MDRRPPAKTEFTQELSDHLFERISRIAQEPDIKAAVEANHDQNRWWPTSVTDWRLRMAVAGWSTRVSYNMVDTYARVVAEVNLLGYDQLTKLPDSELMSVVSPLGLPASRLRYFRSLSDFLRNYGTSGTDLLTMNVEQFVAAFASEVAQASYKVAQCAALYSRGYHCGVIPVDSGMVSKLAPCLGMRFGSGPGAHQEMRQVLEACTSDRAAEYKELARSLGYRVTIPHDVVPTWWVHLVLIYFKRLYCNRLSPRLCSRQPACITLLDCGC